MDCLSRKFFEKIFPTLTENKKINIMCEHIDEHSIISRSEVKFRFWLLLWFGRVDYEKAYLCETKLQSNVCFVDVGWDFENYF